MSVIDINEITAPLVEGDPCGPDLEYAGVSALEELATAKPERQVGTQIIPAAEPNWGEVCTQAQALFKSTRDLRVAVRWAVGLLHTAAWEGFAEGLQLIDTLLTNYWDTVHPKLEAADDFDPTVRLSALGTLADGAIVLRTVRLLPLARSRQLGRACYRDVLIAKGDVKPRGDEEPLDAATIASIFRDADLAELASTQELVNAVIESARRIDDLLDAKEAGRVLEPLIALLRDITRVYIDRIGSRSLASDKNNTPRSAEPARPGVEGPGLRTGKLSTRVDAIAAIEGVIDYFAQHEPSSPIPILLTRARNLIGKDFLSIVNDLVPAGKDQLDVLRGAAGDAPAEGEG